MEIGNFFSIVFFCNSNYNRPKTNLTILLNITLIGWLANSNILHSANEGRAFTFRICKRFLNCSNLHFGVFNRVWKQLH